MPQFKSLIGVPGALQDALAFQEGIECGGEPGVRTASIPQGSAIVLCANFPTPSDGSAGPSDTAAIVVVVTDMTNRDNPQSVAVNVDVASALSLNRIAEEYPWARSLNDWDICIPLDGTLFPNAESTYRLEVKVTPSAGHGGAYYLTPWNLETTRIYATNAV